MLKVEYLSNHLLDFPQIFNLSCEDEIKINSDSNNLNKNEKPDVPSSKRTEAKEM